MALTELEVAIAKEAAQLIASRAGGTVANTAGQVAGQVGGAVTNTATQAAKAGILRRAGGAALGGAGSLASGTASRLKSFAGWALRKTLIWGGTIGGADFLYRTFWKGEPGKESGREAFSDVTQGAGMVLGGAKDIAVAGLGLGLDGAKGAASDALAKAKDVPVVGRLASMVQSMGVTTADAAQPAAPPEADTSTPGKLAVQATLAATGANYATGQDLDNLAKPFNEMTEAEAGDYVNHLKAAKDAKHGPLSGEELAGATRDFFTDAKKKVEQTKDEAEAQRLTKLYDTFDHGGLDEMWKYSQVAEHRPSNSPATATATASAAATNNPAPKEASAQPTEVASTEIRHLPGAFTLSHTIPGKIPGSVIIDPAYLASLTGHHAPHAAHEERYGGERYAGSGITGVKEKLAGNGGASVYLSARHRGMEYSRVPSFANAEALVTSGYGEAGYGQTAQFHNGGRTASTPIYTAAFFGGGTPSSSGFPSAQGASSSVCDSLYAVYHNDPDQKTRQLQVDKVARDLHMDQPFGKPRGGYYSSTLGLANGENAHFHRTGEQEYSIHYKGQTWSGDMRVPLRVLDSYRQPTQAEDHNPYAYGGALAFDNIHQNPRLQELLMAGSRHAPSNAAPDRAQRGDYRGQLRAEAPAQDAVHQTSENKSPPPKTFADNSDWSRGGRGGGHPVG